MSAHDIGKHRRGGHYHKGSPISMIIIGFYLFIKYTQLISTANL